MTADKSQADKYFSALSNALDGLDTYLRKDESPAYSHDVIAAIASGYLKRLQTSLGCWQNKVSFEPKFRVSQTESGFPAFQNVLALQQDKKNAKDRLLKIDLEETIRQQMVDHILTQKSFPGELQRKIAERRYLESIQNGKHFGPLVLPRTIRVSVNPKTGYPYYVVHWGFYDGSANLPMIYMATIEDSSPDIVKALVNSDGKLKKNVKIELPVEGLLNPELALQFDDFCQKNSAYSLMPSTIATNMDHDFDHLHPKQVRRFIFGPFYHSAFTRHGEKVDQILTRVRKAENAWLMTWTMQEIFSVNHKPAKWGLWGGAPAREEFHIETNDLESARMGVTNFQRHALVPHEAYQAIYASGQENEIFDGYEKHVISDGHVLTNM